MMFLCTGVDGAAVSSPAAVRGGGQLPVDGRLALPHDAGLADSHRRQHAPGSEGSLLQGATRSAFIPTRD